MIPMKPDIVVCDDLAALSQEAARRFARLAAGAVAGHGRFAVALSGGSTPRDLYLLLGDEPARSQVPWDQVHLFWADERCVSPGDPDSNYNLVASTLLSRVPIPPENVHRMRGEADPALAAAEYSAEIRRFFGLSAAADSRTWPRFDLVLLGLGDDGHTASLFPGSPALEERRRLAVANYVEKLGANRLTLTLPVLNHAAVVAFLVTGSAKAGIVARVLAGVDTPETLPARLVRPVDGRLVWLVDRAAAAALHMSREVA